MGKLLFLCSGNATVEYLMPYNKQSNICRIISVTGFKFPPKYFHQACTSELTG